MVYSIDLDIFVYKFLSSSPWAQWLLVLILISVIFVSHMHLPTNPPLSKLGTGTDEPVAEAGAFVFLRYFNYCGITMTKE